MTGKYPFCLILMFLSNRNGWKFSVCIMFLLKKSAIAKIQLFHHNCGASEFESSFLIHQYDMYQNQDCLLYCAVKAKVKISSIYSLLTDNLTKTIWHGQTYKQLVDCHMKLILNVMICEANHANTDAIGRLSMV